MGNRNKTRIVFCLLIIIFVLWLTTLAHAEWVDLKGGDLLEQGKCIKDKKPYVCAIVRLETKVYVVLLDRKGEYEIYLVTEKESVLDRKSVV